MQSKDMNREDKDDQDGFSISSLATIRALLASSSLFLPVRLFFNAYTIYLNLIYFSLSLRHLFHIEKHL